MNLLASLIGLIVLAEGMIAISLPGSLVSIARQLLTPSSLYAVAIANVVSGLVLVLAARRSRMPRTLRTAGWFSVAIGILLVGAGFERVIRGLDAWLTIGPANIRVAAALVAALGGTLVYGSGRFDSLADAGDVRAVQDTRTPQTTIAR